MTWQRPRKGRISTGSCLIDSSNRMQVHLPSSPSKLDVNLSPTASLMLEQRSPQQLWNAKTCENIPLVGNGATLRSWGRVTGFPARKLVRLSATMSMSLCLSGNWDFFGAIFAHDLSSRMTYGLGQCWVHWEHHAQLGQPQQNRTVRNFCLQYVIWQNMIYFNYSLEV